MIRRPVENGVPIARSMNDLASRFAVARLLRFAAAVVLLIAGCRGTADLAAVRHAKAVRALIDLGAEVQDVEDDVSHDRGTYVTLFAEHFSHEGKLQNDVLKLIREIRSLFLDVTNTPVKDDAMPDLARLPNLRVLNATLTRLTDRGLKLISASRDIRLLKLNRTRITDEGLECLQDMPSLRLLYLSDTALSDAATVQIAKLPQLEAIKFSHVPITDKGMKSLSEMPRLRFLALDGTAITDAGLEHLNLLPKLTYLDLRETEITDKAIAEFHAAHPKCHIEN